MHCKDLDLEQLLADPLVRMVMSSDGVEEASIRQLAERIAPSYTAGGGSTTRRLGGGSPLRHLPSCLPPRLNCPA